MNRYLSLLIFLYLLLFASCNKIKEQAEIRDFDEIKEKGELTIVTINSSTSYFIYKDEPMGYDYDLARGFCMQHGLKLKIKVAENSTRLVEMLNNGEGDIIAYETAIRNELKDSILYCGPSKVSHQVLVQRANRGDTIVKDVSELIGKEISVKYDTKYHQRLENLNSEIGGGIRIKDIEMDTITSEELIGMVASGEIKYTISDEYVAKLNRTYYNNINISLPISFDQRSSWAVSKNSPQLAKAMNEWFTDNANQPVYRSIIKKYFEYSKRGFEDEIEIATDLPKGAISLYDDLFKKHAQGTRYDWQFLAAISYQESRFRNNLTSWAGASGIMGLMPATGRSLGLADEDRMNPDLSIKAAVQMLDKLDRIYRKVEDKNERLKFMLAAYNGGMGHVNDGQRLAEKYGADPQIWDDNVREYIRLKRYPEYYNDPVCKSGYFRGTETLRYVYDVMANTDRFKKIGK